MLRAERREGRLERHRAALHMPCEQLVSAVESNAKMVITIAS